MSTSLNRLTPTPVRQDTACMCQYGGGCTSFDAGHALHLIQDRVVSATPTEWLDALVTSREVTSGVIEIALVGTGDNLVVWNALGAADAVEVGSPVAFHSRYHVLSAGGRRFNALRVN